MFHVHISCPSAGVGVVFLSIFLSFFFLFFLERGGGLRWAFDSTESLGEMFMFDGVHWPTS